MSKMWSVAAQRTAEYEIVIEAETEGQARALARQAIEEGTRPEGLVEYFDDDTGLDMWSREIE